MRSGLPPKWRRRQWLYPRQPFLNASMVEPPSPAAPIPEDIRRFVLTSIASVPALEALLLLHEAPGSQRSCAEVARRLYLSERNVAGLLQALCQSGLLECTGEGGGALYRYRPRDAALADIVDRLAALYAADLVGVTNLIHDATQKSAQRFADAFKLRKD
jgi:DNA-binding IscR family transcriptional regulator